MGQKVAVVDRDGASRSWILAGGRIAYLGLENDACRVAVERTMMMAVAGERTWTVTARRCIGLVSVWLKAEPEGQVTETKTGKVRIDVD